MDSIGDPDSLGEFPDVVPTPADAPGEYANAIPDDPDASLHEAEEVRTPDSPPAQDAVSDT